MQARSQQQNQAATRSSSTTPSLVLRDVPTKGRGVFTTRPFAKGDEVLEFLGEICDVDDFSDLTYALQIGPREFLSSSGGIDDFVNHSCQPNSGIRNVQGRIVLFALRALARDEEITFDYSTTQAGGFWEMECHCGAPTCRGRIGDFKDLPQAFRSRYVRLGAVLPFLVSRT